MTAAAYIRVSTEQQKADGSHHNQRERIETWADRHDYDLEVFQDIAVSGQSGRPKKLDDELINEVIDLRSKDVSYSAIARVMESKPNGPESISRNTIRRYCQTSSADLE